MITSKNTQLCISLFCIITILPSKSFDTIQVNDLYWPSESVDWPGSWRHTQLCPCSWCRQIFHRHHVTTQSPRPCAPRHMTPSTCAGYVRHCTLETGPANIIKGSTNETVNIKNILKFWTVWMQNNHLFLDIFKKTWHMKINKKQHC